MKSKLLGLIACVAFLGSSSAHADILYDVDLTIGSATVTGFIETDGKIGFLSRSDIS